MCCHLTPNSINVPPEMSRQTQQHSACTKPTPWRSRPPGSTCQALPSTTHCSLACPPGGRCWCCTRWFAGFVAGTTETGAHVDPDADLFGGRAVEGDFTSRRRRNWHTGTGEETCPAPLLPHSPFVQGLRVKCHYNCRSACMRVAGWWVHVAARHGPVNQLWLRV